jgi:hypothetical protein
MPQSLPALRSPLLIGYHLIGVVIALVKAGRLPGPHQQCQIEGGAASQLRVNFGKH